MGLEATSKKFSSNGSLLSQNGLKAAYSEPDMAQQQLNRDGNPAEYVHLGEGGGTYSRTSTLTPLVKVGFENK